MCLNFRAFLGVFRFARIPVRRTQAVSPRGEAAMHPIEERRSPERFRGKERPPTRKRMSHALTSMCVAQIFLDSCSDQSGNSHRGTGGVESYFLCLSRALSDRTCRAFYFPAHIADIGWQLRRSRPPNRTVVRNPAISRTSPTVACSAVRRSRALCGSPPKATGRQHFGLNRGASSQARRGRTVRRDCSMSRRSRNGCSSRRR